MKNKITLLIFTTLFLISFISAINIDAGEVYSVTLEKPYSYYTITGNSTPINITSSGSLVNITINKYSLNESFDIVFYGTEDEVIDESTNEEIKETTWVGKRTTNKIENNTEKLITLLNGTTISNKTIELNETEEEKGFNILYIIIPIVILIILIIIFFLRKRYIDERGFE